MGAEGFTGWYNTSDITGVSVVTGTAKLDHCRSSGRGACPNIIDQIRRGLTDESTRERGYHQPVSLLSATLRR